MTKCGDPPGDGAARSGITSIASARKPAQGAGRSATRRDARGLEEGSKKRSLPAQPFIDHADTRPLHWLPQMDTMTKRLGAAIYLLLAAVLAVHCYRNSMFDIDLLSFAGNVALSDTSDVEKAHAMVYRERLTTHLLGTDTDDAQARMLRMRAADANYWALYLPYFSVKPLYVLAMEAAHRVGASVIDASRIVSALSYFGIAVALWLYTRTPLALVILILPESMILGQANEPDGMSVMLLLFALWAIFMKGKSFGIIPLIVSVWVRPDNAILCILVLAYLAISGKLEWGKGVALVALTLASEIFISHYGYGWRSLYFHTFLGGDPGQIAHFGAGDYVRALAAGSKEAMHSSLVVYGILWGLCLRLVNGGLRRVLVVVGLFSLARFVIFPNYEVRYFGLFFIVTAAAAVVSIAYSFGGKGKASPLRV